METELKNIKGATMRNLKIKLSSLIIIVVLIATLGGCGDHTSIEQSKQIHNYDCECDKVYLISTKVWVNNWSGLAQGLPYWETTVCGLNDLDSVMAVEYKKAEREAQRIDKCLEKL